MKETCEDCQFCRRTPSRIFEEYEKKTRFGSFLAGRWIDGEESVCYALPETRRIDERKAIACSLFAMRIPAEETAAEAAKQSEIAEAKYGTH
jgi:hypothetical protein